LALCLLDEEGTSLSRDPTRRPPTDRHDNREVVAPERRFSRA
jgi:hypothetical protein